MKNAIIIFTRVPAPGKTKTRLGKALSPADCAKAHGAFLLDVFRKCRSLPDTVFVFHTDDAPVRILRDLLHTSRNLFPQSGGDLGERMYRAIADVLGRGYEKCVLIGSDIPTVKPGCIEGAFQKLDEADIVFGPSVDGGYYLVGMKKPYKAVFDHQIYGNESVLEKAVRTVLDTGCSYALEAPCQDIDEPEDLWRLAQKISRGEEACPFTEAFLKEMGWLLPHKENRNGFVPAAFPIRMFSGVPERTGDPARQPDPIRSAGTGGI